MLQFLHISRVVKDGIHTFDLVDRDLSDTRRVLFMIRQNATN